MPLKRYLISLPERLSRAALGLGAGLTREIADVSLPSGVRDSRIYQNVVDATLRFLIEEVGGADRVPSGDPLPDDFLIRRTAGNAIELLGIAAFRASPVWVLAAIADVCGFGRYLIPEIADALKAEGLLDEQAQVTSVDQVLDGLERTSARMAAAVNTPPLDVAALRQEWNDIRAEARRIRPMALPSRAAIEAVWKQLQDTSARQQRSIFQTSSMIALSAARAGAVRTGRVVGSQLLQHYARTLTELQRVGFTAYARRQLRPYVQAAASQLSPARRTLTERVLDRF